MVISAMVARQRMRAKLSPARHLAVDAYGNLFIADSDDDVIREVTSSQGRTLTLYNVCQRMMRAIIASS